MTEEKATTTTAPSSAAEVVPKPEKREKFKDSNGIRVRDEHGYRLRAAGLCARESETSLGEKELLLVSGRGTLDKWVLPGGGIEETDKNAEQAAIREVYEEAGIRASVRLVVGEFVDDERLNRTLLYVLNVEEELDDWEDGRNGRLRSWMTPEEALEKIKSSQRVMLERCIAAL